ncbi:MAG: purine-nucleoside phosphorylase [Flammeovirgaceae bacterium]|nr:MAG: purine-nucleoside phosphorylase [Flammeovirgaceae bacterium]
MLQQVKEATDFIKHRINAKPEVGIILGTGLGNRFVESIRKPVIINYNAIPHFPITTVATHKGQLVVGEVSGKHVITMRGRLHYYEGYSMHQIALPIRVMKMLGVKVLLISNAAGNLNPAWKKGELMLLNDHINLMPDNPLRGENYEIFGPRFPDMSEPYSANLQKKLLAIAAKKKIKLRPGVYAAVQGPSLETRAEYRYLRTIGADAVGMSTVPEVLTAQHAGITCCAVSVLTNECNPDKGSVVKLENIVSVAGRAEKHLVTLFTELIAAL